MSAIEVEDIRDSVAIVVTETWTMLNNRRTAALNRMEETRAYVTAPNTTHTEVGSLPWRNKTTVPILTQIADSLQANYMAALMPEEDFFKWEGHTEEDQEKANKIEMYMSTKIQGSGFRNELEKLVRDWVIYGNAFASVGWEDEKIRDLVTGEMIQGYRGPKLQRISPIDCVIDIRATDWDNTPFIHREILPLTDVLMNEEYPLEKRQMIKDLRGNVVYKDFVDQHKDNGLRIDGYQTFDNYLNSMDIEKITYQGDIYDRATGEVLKNRRVVIVDRSFVLVNSENPSWSGKKPVAHAGWRVLPDNLMGQGPLENLVGMQYRVDHLENLKADAFDQIIHPMIKVKGDQVEDFQFGPGQRIYVGTDGDVEFLRPDSSVLAANNEIANYQAMMERSAGAPREMAGFRTAGEKTAFEVNVLSQGADRMFQDKLNHFEENLIKPVLSLFFELLIRNFDVADIARTFNDNENILEEFRFTKEDVVATGVFRPQGAKHFAARNKRVQELQNLLAISQNPSLAPHFSGVNTAKMLEEELGFQKWNVVESFIGLREQFQGQMLAQQMQQQAAQMTGQPIESNEPDQENL